ncbi:27277_t:CDS:2, partial [Racocetra persica]
TIGGGETLKNAYKKAIKKVLARKYKKAKKQRKPCGSLTRENKAWDNHCCPCYYQEKRESSQAYTNYQQVYKQVARKQQAKIQQLKLLREYAGCVECGSQE